MNKAIILLSVLMLTATATMVVGSAYALTINGQPPSQTPHPTQANPFGCANGPQGTNGGAGGTSNC